MFGHGFQHKIYKNHRHLISVRLWCMILVTWIQISFCHSDRLTKIHSKINDFDIKVAFHWQKLNFSINIYSIKVLFVFRKFGFWVFTSLTRIRWNQAPCPLLIQYFHKAYGVMAHQKSVMITYCFTWWLWPTYKCIIWWQHVCQFWRNQPLWKQKYLSCLEAWFADRICWCLFSHTHPLELYAVWGVHVYVCVG